MSDKFGHAPPEKAFSESKVLFEDTAQGRKEIQALCAAKKLTLVGTVISDKGAQVGKLRELIVDGARMLCVECAGW